MTNYGLLNFDEFDNKVSQLVINHAKLVYFLNFYTCNKYDIYLGNIIMRYGKKKTVC